MTQYERFIAFCCPKCGKWQSRENRKHMLGMTDPQKIMCLQKLILECTYCNKSTKFVDKRKGGTKVKHEWFGHPGAGAPIVQHYNEVRK